jgi:hypothetical protein
VRRGPKPKDRAKSPLALDVHRFKKEDSVDSVDLVVPSGEPAELNSSASSATAQREMQLRRKRAQVVSPPTVQKRPRKPSVQSQTLSVTRIPGPVVTREGAADSRMDITDESREEVNHEARRGDRFLPGPKLPAPALTSNSQSGGSPLAFPERKPRSLRVSLNLPDEVEPGSPMEKVMRSQKLLSPKFAISSLPLWDDDDLGPKTTVSISTANPPMIKSPPSSGGKIVTLSSHKGSSESRSPSPKKEGGPLTPFTASALPLQPKTSEGTGDRKRRSREDREDVVEDSLAPKRPKPTLKSPPNSPLEDVFVSPVKAEVELISNTCPSSREATDIVGTQAPDSCTVVANLEKVGQSKMDPAILPQHNAAPVGYGSTQPQGEDPTPYNLPTPPNDTPSVVTVQPLPANQAPLGTSTSLPVNSPPHAIKPAVSSRSKGGQPAVIKSTPSQVSNPNSSAPPSTTVKIPSNAAVVETNPSPVSQNPSVSLASSLPPHSTSGATAVSVITSTANTPTSASSATKQKPFPKSKDSDIIITGVEIRPPQTSSVGPSDLKHTPHSTALQRSALSPTVCSSLTKVPTTTSPVAATSTQAHPRLSGKHQRAVPGNRVATKIVEPTSSPALQQPPQKSVPGASEGAKQIQSRPEAGSIRSQTPVSVATTPTGYTSTGVGTAAYTIIPTDTVASGGQGVTTAIAVPPPVTTRAIKPGTLQIKDSATTVVPPHTAAAPTIHYIIEPLVQAATTPVIYSQTTGVPVVTHTQPSSANVPVYHTEIASSKSPMPVTTTKPYAIVSAQPTASIEIQGFAVNQQGTPLISPQVQFGYGSVSTAPYIQTVVTPSSNAKHSIHTMAGSSSSAKQCKISEMARMSPTARSASSHPQTHEKSQLEEIGKNISDAFATSSEQMLIAAFEDAWKKFQANGRRYQAPKSGSRKTGGQPETGGKPIPPPNAEVVSVPGTSSRLSLIRPTYSRSKMPVVQSAPDQLVCVPADAAAHTRLAVTTTPDLQQKQHPMQIIYCSSPSVQQQVYNGGSEYSGPALYTVAPNNAQSYNVVQHQLHRGGKSVGSKITQVHTSGIYIPAHASDVSLKNQQPTAVVVEPVATGGLSKSMVHAPRSQQPIIVNDRGVPVKQQEQVAVQHLSVLKKSQTIVIGGGDHQQVGGKLQQKATSVGSAGKVTRQCALCTKEATYLCSGCHRIWYCGKDCQLKAWEEHSESCRS